MIKNKWLMISYFLGLTITIGLCSSMPLYTDAMMNRMLVKDLEHQQEETGLFAGAFRVYLDLHRVNAQKKEAVSTETAAILDQQIKNKFQLPINASEQFFNTIHFSAIDAVQKSKMIRVSAAKDLFEHVQLIDGHFPSSQVKAGVVEVMVSERALNKIDAVIGKEFTTKDKAILHNMKFKITGVFEKKDAQDLYFSKQDLSNFEDCVVANYSLFKDLVIDKHEIALGSVEFYRAMDYSKVKLSQRSAMIEADQMIAEWLKNHGSTFNNQRQIPMMGLLETYEQREQQLRVFILSINIPVMFLLLFYMYMVADILIERQRNEISVLRSRGYSRRRIMSIFLLEGFMIGMVSFGCGIVLAKQFVEMMGASNGFLNFVHRTSLPVHLHAAVFEYATFALLITVLMTLVPAYRATQISIVERKLQMVNRKRVSTWHLLYLDVIAIAISAYGLYSFHTKMNVTEQQGGLVEDFTMNPLQFFLPALFLIGIGFLLLRLYPIGLRFIYFIGKKWWGPTAYAMLLQIGRTSSQYQYLMYFLMMTISLGVFSSSCARTINLNTDERIRYQQGADVVLQTLWPKDERNNAAELQTSNRNPERQPVQTRYYEPPLEPLVQLPQIQSYAKVFVKEGVRISGNVSDNPITLMAIDSYDFGNTAWFQNNVMNHPLNEYLNLLTSNPSAVLISRTIANSLKVKVGDSFAMTWDGAANGSFIVFGIVDYFPTFSPYPAKDQLDQTPMLIVANLSKIQSELALEPYQLWLKLKPNGDMTSFYQTIADQKLQIISIRDTYAQLYEARHDPFLQSINGVLTLSFIVSLSVCFIGFLLFWILSIERRSFQFGIFRALGISFRSLIGMIILEQLLTSGVAVLFGMIIGNYVSKFFIPLFEPVFNTVNQVPPFRVIFKQSDVLQIYWLVSIMLILGLIILSMLISKINMNQALKLGEE